MSDSQRPSTPAPSFEVPDLELEPLARPLPRAAPTKARSPAPPNAQAKTPANAQAQMFGSSFDFGDELDDLEFERSARPNFQIGPAITPRVASAKRASPAAAEPETTWPTGRAPEAAELELDPLELAILADYGDPPQSAPLTLAYAYRVFTRQRELKQQLLPIVAECERAQAEREATLAELAREVRPAIEQMPEFRRVLAPILELERSAAERGKALTTINAQLGRESGKLDAELSQVTGQLAALQRQELDAQRQYDERDANAKRAEAKLKRVQIEMRAVTQVAEQKLGPEGGQIPDAEAAQLASLRQRAEALQPDLTQARIEFDRAKQALNQLHAELAALRHGELQISREKQALGGAYEKELAQRRQGVGETELAQRAALAELGRAILATRGTVEIPAALIERVRRVDEHADRLIVRAEMQRRAIAAYDVERARQGVRLACTAVGLIVVLFAFKLIF